MCDNQDLEGVRLWFYGGTPPLDEAGADDHASPATSTWAWPMSPQGQAAADPRHDSTREFAAV
ncbi:hypothetical protein [Ideonella sp.]|uniref:hypothetical protein n=1 Tax=Ideonella sp. TaxID=1929293 RepID=UPI0035B435E9